MAQKAQEPEKYGIYLYAVSFGRKDFLYNFTGINDKPVYGISDGRLIAIVSNISAKKVRPERRHIAATQAVIKKLMESVTVLPMSFGTIANSKKAVKKILHINRESFVRQLEHVKNRVEMGVIVKWDVPDFFEYFTNKHPKLQLIRNKMFKSHHEPSREEKLHIGELFYQLLEEDRHAYVQMVENVLSKYCAEIKENPLHSEKEVMNLACLVNRDGQKSFETGIFEAAKNFDDNFLFNYSGPWAPHNFVNIHIKSA